MDGDPELFRQFLKEFPLNVKQMKLYLPITPNLDRSLMDIIAVSRHMIIAFARIGDPLEYCFNALVSTELL